MKKSLYLLVLIIPVMFLFLPKKKTDLITVTKPVHVSLAKENEEAESDAMDQLMKQNFNMTRDPALNSIPKERLIEGAERMKAMTLSAQSPQSMVWSERGPNNIGGRVRTLLFDKSDATGNTVLVAGVSGGIFRTTNFKNASPSYTPVNNLLGSLSISAMAQDPRPGSNNIMYAGTGEGYFNLDDSRGIGIYKSTNNGLTWSILTFTTSPAANASNFDYVQRIVVDNSGNVYAACRSRFCNRGGLWKSTDGGTSWARVIGTSTGSCGTSVDLNANDVEIAANGDVYATVGVFTTGKIFRSDASVHLANTGNAGTFTDITPTGSFWRIELATAPSNASRVYALFQGAGSNDVSQIRRTDNSGTSWTAAGAIPVPTIYDQGNNNTFTRSQAWYDLTIAVDPNFDDTLIIGGVDLLRSYNAGTSWTQISNWTGAEGIFSGNQYVHADQHIALYEGTSSSSAVFGCDGGVFYSSAVNSAGLPTFSSKNTSLNITQYYSADIHPSSTNYIIGGTQDNGSLRLNAAGIASASTVVGGDGAFAHIDQVDGLIQKLAYVKLQYAFTKNSGTNWYGFYDFDIDGDPLDEDARFINPTDFDDKSKVLYSADSIGRYDIITGITNVPGSSPLISQVTVASFGVRQVSALKVDTLTGNRVWFGLTDDINFTLAPILVRVDNANTAPIATPAGALPGAAAGAYISSIDVEPGNANHLLVTLSNYGVVSVYESTDGGTSFTNVEGNLPDIPVRWGMFLPTGVTLSPNAISGVVLGTELGVFSTTALSGGATAWTANNYGLANVRVDMLTYRSSTRTLLAATHGRGIYTATLFLLPVKYLSFEGKTSGADNVLYWSTASEQNNKRFEVERKQNGETSFSTIGTVQANQAGTLTQRYSFTDKAVDASKTNFSYRLKQVDMDGKSSYSSIVTINRRNSGKAVEYISATKQQLFIKVNSSIARLPLQVQLLSTEGRIVLNRQINSDKSSLDISVLPAGTYTVRITGKPDILFTQQFVK